MYKYYTVPVIHGGINDIYAYPFIDEALQCNPNSRMIKIKAVYPKQKDWTEITEEEFEIAKQAMLEPPA